MRALVIGYGRMGAFHAGALADLGHDVTTVDPCLAASADYHIVPRGPGHEVDIVCIATPIAHLAEQAAEWAGHDGWLLIEKPFAADLHQGRELADVLQGQRVAVGYVERFNPRVQDLREQLDGQAIVSAAFTRWNDRPSPDVAVDLVSHDVDLARFLGVRSPRFSAMAAWPVKRRRIIAHTDTGTHVANLLDHRQSPLHTMWTSFLSDGLDVATPDDAVHVLETLAARAEPVAA